jgi:hypothetical protein
MPKIMIRCPITGRAVPTVPVSRLEMPPDPSRKSEAELLDKSNLGKIRRLFDDAGVVQLLREAVGRDGSISAFARRTGLNLTIVSATLNGRRAVSGPLVKALGLRKVYTAD